MHKSVFVIKGWLFSLRLHLAAAWCTQARPQYAEGEHKGRQQPHLGSEGWNYSCFSQPLSFSHLGPKPAIDCWQWCAKSLHWEWQKLALPFFLDQQNQFIKHNNHLSDKNNRPTKTDLYPVPSSEHFWPCLTSTVPLQFLSLLLISPPENSDHSMVFLVPMPSTWHVFIQCHTITSFYFCFSTMIMGSSFKILLPVHPVSYFFR